MTGSHQPWIAEVPLLDWTGPRFLGFYVVALLVVTIWCWRRSRRSLGRYDRQDTGVDGVDHFESAFLAAGPARVAQLAVAGLLHRGFVKWKPGLLGARLLAGEPTGNTRLPVPEKELLDRVNASSTKGLALKDVPRAVAPAMRGIEVSLAAKGLRPTREERSSAGMAAVAPLIVLGGLGVLKLFIGLSRDKPVGFLAVLLFITLIVICVVWSAVPRLTVSGESLLANLRGRNDARRRAMASPEEGGPDMVMGSLALFGPAALASMPLFEPIHGDLEKLQAQAAAGSGGSGCSGGMGASGCGSSGGDSGGSGCGGGGCGGCGGGGGD